MTWGIFRKKKRSFSNEDIDLIKRSAFFDGKWYKNTYKIDLRKFNDPAEHYLLEGEDKGFLPSTKFDPIRYLKAYPDVRSTGMNALLHYEKFGRQEGRKTFSTGYDINSPKLTEILMEKIGYVSPTSMKKAPDKKILYPSIRFGFDPFSHPKYKSMRGARRRQYEVMAQEFDADYYMLLYQDILRAYKADGFNPLIHYMDHGYKEGRNPAPWFNTRFYMDNFPEVRSRNINPFYHYLTEGRSAGLPCSPLHAGGTTFDFVASRIIGNSPNSIEKYIRKTLTEYRKSLDHGQLAEEVKKASKLDPLVGLTMTTALAPVVYPFISPAHTQQMKVLYELFEAAEFRSAKLIILVDSPRYGGGLRMEGYIAHSLQDYYGENETVVIMTDNSGDMPQGKFPDDVRIIPFSDISQKLPADSRVRIFVEFLRALKPDSIFSINSKLMWDSLKTYRSQIVDICKVFGCFFADDKTLFNEWAGYPSINFYRHFDSLDGVCMDSNFLAEQLRQRHLVPPQQERKLIVLPAPVDPQIPYVCRPGHRIAPGDRPRIFWAGRFDRQKRVDIAYEVAKHLPYVDFQFWGSKVLDSYDPEEGKPDNVTLHDSFQRFTDLPLKECDIWLYTSEWDGVPSMLIEVSMTGIPVVASRVGGVDEVILPGYGWLVDNIEDVMEYVNHIKWILNNWDEALNRTQELRNKLIRERTWQNYKNILINAISNREEEND